MKYKFGILQEMARVGFIPPNDAKGIEVYVHTDDKGNTPHFHVRKRSSHNRYKWEACIRYDSPKYFSHGRYNSKIDNKTAEDLDSMLRSQNIKNPGKTYWETCVIEWNQNNSSVELPMDLEQPDYTQLNK